MNSPLATFSLSDQLGILSVVYKEFSHLASNWQECIQQRELVHTWLRVDVTLSSLAAKVTLSL